MTTQARLKELFDYNPESGVFTRIVAKPPAAKGDVAGCVDKSTGYMKFNVDGKVYLAHRLAWLYVHGSLPADKIDHVNGNRADNRLSNLREADNSLNMQNLKRARRDSKTQVLGVTLCAATGKYVGRIRANGRYLSCGRFDTVEQAHAAYLTAKREMHEGCTL